MTKKLHNFEPKAHIVHTCIANRNPQFLDFKPKAHITHVHVLQTETHKPKHIRKRARMVACVH